MSISQIGANAYVNQNSQVVSSQMDAQLKTGQYGNITTSELAKDENDGVMDTRAAEETYKIDPENEQEKQNKQEFQQNEETQNSEENKEENYDKEESNLGNNLDWKI